MQTKHELGIGFPFGNNKKCKNKNQRWAPVMLREHSLWPSQPVCFALLSAVFVLPKLHPYLAENRFNFFRPIVQTQIRKTNLFWLIVSLHNAPVNVVESTKEGHLTLSPFVEECHSEINGLPLTFNVLGCGICLRSLKVYFMFWKKRRTIIKVILCNRGQKENFYCSSWAKLVAVSFFGGPSFRAHGTIWNGRI